MKFIEGHWIWLPHPTDGFIAAQLLSTSATTFTARSQQDEHFVVSLSALDSLQCTSLPSVALLDSDVASNLTELEELSEGSILHALRQRYNQDVIYTSISDILISINPYKQLPCYGPHAMRTIHAQLTSPQKPVAPPLPHVYALAHAAYTQLVTTDQSQSLVIAGESGAGKTEATKLCLQYLAEVSGVGDAIEQQILEANPILEAFGNSRTVKNHNSSRFGKFITVHFNERFKIKGAEIRAYLLEKSRVCSQSDGETNFHVFYSLCQECTEAERAKYHILPSSQCKILRPAERCEVSWKELRRALNVLSFSDSDQDAIFRALSAILRIGNLEFEESGTGKTCTANEEQLNIIAYLLCIEKTKLRAVLVSRRLLVNGEVITQQFTASQCADMQQSLCKSFYSSIFSYLIDHINATLKPKSAPVTQAPVVAETRWIGVLDIFGFENFPQNQWEQLCINFANEKLQQHFISICLSMEQAEYSAEGVPCAVVDFVDNTACLDLIESKRTGIIDMIAEEIRLPKGSDRNLLSRMHAAYEKKVSSSTPSVNAADGMYIKPKMMEPTFGVKHYAGNVIYQVDGMCDKNRGDALSEDVFEALDSCSDSFLRELLYWGKKDMSAALGETKSGASGAAIVRSTSRVPVTQGAQFRTQLAELVKMLNETCPHFLKCLKPNADKIPDHFDGAFVNHQLGYLGIREVVKVRKGGYPVRIKRAEFLSRYRLLFSPAASNLSESERVQHLMTSHGVSDTRWFNGKTKVLLKADVQSLLEEKRKLVIACLIVRIQARYRTKLLTRRYQSIKQCARDLIAATNQKDSLETLDALISRATDLDLPFEMVNKAKQARHRMWQCQQSRSELSASVKSRDRGTIEAALARAIVLGLEDTCTELQQARSWLQNHDTYIKEVHLAIQARNLQMLGKCLEFASIQALDSPLEQEALEMQRRLQLELELSTRLENAISSANLCSGDLDALLVEAGVLKFESPLVYRARLIVSTLRVEQQRRDREAIARQNEQSKRVEIIRDQLVLARDSLDVELIREILLSVEQKEAVNVATLLKSDVSGVYNKCTSFVASIESYEQACKAAVSNAQRAALASLLQQAQQNHWDSLPCVTEMATALKELDRDQELQTLLASAIESRQSNVLQAAIEKAERRAKQRGSGFKPIHLYDHQLQQAQTILRDLESEVRLQEQDAAANRPVSEKRRSLVSAAISPVQQPPLVTRSDGDSTSILRAKTPFLAAPFLSLQLALHLCPLLRSPDDFVRGAWMKSALKKGMLSHTKETLGRSLTCLDDIYPENDHKPVQKDTGNLNTIALSLFKAIQGWMGDRVYSFQDSLAHDVLSEGCKEPFLRDELYLQCIKQLRDNPKSDSCIRGWQMLGLLSESFRPTPPCLPYVYNFLLTTAHRSDPLMLGYINYTTHCLHHREPSLKPPTLTHITSYRDRLMNTSILPLYFSDGSIVDVEVSPDISVAAVMARVKAWLGLIPPARYDRGEQEAEDENVDGLAIFMCGPGNKEVCVGVDECLLDYPASQCQDGSMTFMLKKRFFTVATSEFASMHPLIASMVYHQCIREACSGIYDLPRAELIEVLAVHRRIRVCQPFSVIGRSTPVSDGMRDLKPLVFAYWDAATISSFEKEVDRAVDMQDRTGTKPNLEQVFQIMKKRKEFASSLFLVTQDDRKELPHSLLVAVNTFGICLINDSSKKLISAFKFQHITGWASNSVRFCLRILIAKGKTIQLNFKTDKGKRIVRTIQECVDFILNEQQRIPRAVRGSVSVAKEIEECKEQPVEDAASRLASETIIHVL